MIKRKSQLCRDDYQESSTYGLNAQKDVEREKANLELQGTHKSGRGDSLWPSIGDLIAR